MRRRIGIIILYLAGVLVTLGSLFDLFVPSVPSNHLSYVGVTDKQSANRFAVLDLAMLKALGGCLLAVGVTSLILTSGPIRRGDCRWARWAVLVLIGVAEGNNAYRMYPFGSPWYAPLSFVLLAIFGVVLVGSASSVRPLGHAPEHIPSG